MFDALGRMGLDVAGGTALDFGCGVGRLSLPLASRFARVTGIDASPTMVRRARELAGQQGVANVEYVTGRDLRIEVPSGSQDLVLSLITLQHVPARAQVRYVSEFARVLAPDGIAVFQVITGHADEPTSRMRRQYRRAVPQHVRERVRRALRPGKAAPEMHCVRRSSLLGAISRADAKTVAEAPDQAAPGWASHRLVIRRR